MDKLKDLLKAAFDLFVEQRWLKTIDKELNKFNRIKRERTKVDNELQKQQYILNMLIKRYNEIYGEKLEPLEIGGADNGRK